MKSEIFFLCCVQDPSFCPAEVATKSSAAEGMCLWVLNTVDFYKIYCEVEPKKQALKKANDELQAAEKNLKRIQGKVKVSIAGKPKTH